MGEYLALERLRLKPRSRFLCPHEQADILPQSSDCVSSSIVLDTSDTMSLGSIIVFCIATIWSPSTPSWLPSASVWVVVDTDFHNPVILAHLRKTLIRSSIPRQAKYVSLGSSCTQLLTCRKALLLFSGVPV